jgi:hypothetical protein
MVAVLIVILAILWFLGYIHIDAFNIPDTSLFTVNGQTVTIIDLLILAIVSVAISILPNPFRAIAGILLILWILSVLGIISLTGIALSNILVIAILIGLIASLFS